LNENAIAIVWTTTVIFWTIDVAGAVKSGAAPVEKATASHVHPMQGDEIRVLRRLQREQGLSSHVFVTEREGAADRTRSHRRCWTSRPDLGERWPSRLVATASSSKECNCRNGA